VYRTASAMYGALFCGVATTPGAACCPRRARLGLITAWTTAASAPLPLAPGDVPGCATAVVGDIEFEAHPYVVRDEESLQSIIAAKQEFKERGV
jgi:hypothetical protein